MTNSKDAFPTLSPWRILMSAITLSLYGGIFLGTISLPATASVFGSEELEFTDMGAFNKWSDMWRRHHQDNATNGEVQPDGASKLKICAGETATPECQWHNIIALFSRKSGGPLLPTLRSVNSVINGSRYIIDPINWGVPDYWATPLEFMRKDGDCEDYAISKYIVLKAIGVDPASMRLVVLQDENLDAAHAVLTVFLQGQWYVLDNQVDGVLTDQDILHYRPIYSINESNWWLHGEHARQAGR